MDFRFYNKNHNYPIKLTENGELIIVNEKVKAEKQRLIFLRKQLMLLTDETIFDINKMPPSVKVLISKPLTDHFKYIKKKKQKTTDDLLAIKTLEKFGIIETRLNELEKLKKKTLKNCLLAGVHKEPEAQLVENFLKTKKLKPQEEIKIPIDRIKIAKFVDRYKSQTEIQDYAFFRETLKNYGLTDEKEILGYFNDSIDSNYTTEEFKMVSHMKNKIQDLQLRIIKAAIEDGFLPPSDLIPFTNPTLRKVEKISPENIDLIKQINLEKMKIPYTDFDNPKVKEKLSKRFKEEFEIYNKKDLEPSIELLNLFVIKNNGIHFGKMTEWADFAAKNAIIDTKKAHKFIIDVNNHCKELEKIGILQKTGEGKYKFTNNNARSFLGNNYNVIPNNLGKFMLKEFEEQPKNEQKIRTKDLIKELKNFNFFYQMSNDPKYVKRCKIEEKLMMKEIKKEISKSPQFKEELRDYIHKNIDREEITKAFIEYGIDYFVLKKEQQINIIDNIDEFQKAKRTREQQLNCLPETTIQDYIKLEQVSSKILNELSSQKKIIPAPAEFFNIKSKLPTLEECLKDIEQIQTQDLSL